MEEDGPEDIKKEDEEVNLVENIVQDRMTGKVGLMDLELEVLTRTENNLERRIHYFRNCRGD